jgi:thioredoxin
MKVISITLLNAMLALVVGCNQRTPKTDTNPSIESSKEISGNSKKFVVYDFWAPWCGPCRAFTPTFEQWKAKYTSSNVTFTRVNVDEESDLATKFQIRNIPTVVVTADSKEIKRFEGAPQEQEIVKLLK